MKNSIKTILITSLLGCNFTLLPMEQQAKEKRKAKLASLHHKLESLARKYYIDTEYQSNGNVPMFEQAKYTVNWDASDLPASQEVRTDKEQAEYQSNDDAQMFEQTGYNINWSASDLPATSASQEVRSEDSNKLSLDFILNKDTDNSNLDIMSFFPTPETHLDQMVTTEKEMDSSHIQRKKNNRSSKKKTNKGYYFRTENGKYACAYPDCTKVLKSNGSITDHYEIKHLNSTFVCTICGNTLCSKRVLARHKRDVHPN